VAQVLYIGNPEKLAGIAGADVGSRT
jgi:hypothetical protein